LKLLWENLKGYKLPGTDQITAELMQTAGNTLRFEIHKLTNSIWSEELPQQLKESVIVTIYRNSEKMRGNIQ
jgi:hypothetical protein